MWWVTSGAGVEHAGAHEREHAIEVADDVGLAGVQGQGLDPGEAHVHLAALGVDADDAHRGAVGGHADGEVERARVADGVDGHVDAAPVGGGLTAARGSSSVRCTGAAPKPRGHVEACLRRRRWR